MTKQFATSKTGCSKIIPRILVSLMTVLAIGAATAMDVQAQIEWDNMSGSPNPLFHTDTNWVGNSRPGSADTALFNLDNTYEVWWSSTTESLSPEVGQLQLVDGEVTFRSIQLGPLRKLQINGSGGTGSYQDFSVSGANTSLNLFGVHMHSLGRAEIVGGASLNIGAPGEAPSLLTVDSFLDVSGNLTLQNGGDVNGSTVYIGRNLGTTGTVTVAGTGASFNLANNIYVGHNGEGSINIESGGQVTGDNVYIGRYSNSTGTATVSGLGSTWTNSSNLNVGSSGNGSLNIENEGVVSKSIGYMGSFSTGVGVATVTGFGSQWINSAELYVGYSGNATLNIKNFGLVSNGTANIGYGSSSSGTVNVSSQGSWDTSGFLTVGSDGSGQLKITSGTVTNTAGHIGRYSGSTGDAEVKGFQARWENSSGLLVGSSGNGELSIQSGGTVTSSYGRIGSSSSGVGVATVSDWGEWNMAYSISVGNSGDGTLNVQTSGKVTNDDGVIARYSGSIGTVNVEQYGTWHSAGNLSIGGSSSAAGGSGTLNINGDVGEGLVRVDGITKIWSTGTVNLNGGRFEFGETSIAEFSTINGVSGSMAGNLNHAGYTNASTLVALQNAAVDLTDVTLTNSGTLYGDAAFGTKLINTSTGELETMVGERMRFAGSGNTNAGEINNFGGNIRFEQDLINEASGFISGRGSFVANAGWDNQGVMAFVGGFSEVLGDVNNHTGGTIVVSGGSTTTFYDDVIHNGAELRTAAGSQSVFLGEVSGAGAFTGLGTVFMEGDLRPGNSPAIVQFEGDLVLGSGAVLFTEIGGFEAGEFDQLITQGNLFLNGQLQVALIDGFQLTYNDQFLIADVAGELQGQFVGLEEGDLVANMQGMDLFISYAGGDGNDVVLFTAVPEPSTLPAILLCISWIGLRRRRR